MEGDAVTEPVPDSAERSEAPGFDVVPVRWVDGAVEVLDQRLLPSEEQWVRLDGVRAVERAIVDMTVRGAPTIGITAAYGMAVCAVTSRASTPAALLEELDRAGAYLAAARPTAVNLAWAVKQVLRRVGDAAGADATELAARVLECAVELADSERDACRRIGANAVELVGEGARILTHCNAGALATGGYGTALGVVRGAVEAGRAVSVWVDETRPLLQGARLTAWELDRAGIPNTLVVDGAAASLMARGLVDLCVVGADRIAANGDVANKIGTYSVALAAAAHDIPFYVAAPSSTIDRECPEGSRVRIEERSPEEVTAFAGATVAPVDQDVANPAFDVTPARLVTAIVTEAGVVRPPYRFT